MSLNVARYLLGIVAICTGLVTATVYVVDGTDLSLSNKTFDYVIVGCGPAGLVVANRLSEDVNSSVICMEAGPL
jgi:ribulose 1,5-bisphosphate synthetase/thiazole synthase